MIIPTAEPWLDANQRYLSAAVEEVRVALDAHLARAEGVTTAAPLPVSASSADGETPPALETVCDLFRLSPFERAVLVLCAGMELDGRIAPLCAAAHGDPQRAYPSFALALAALPHPHWSALTPDRPLRRWRLIEVGAGAALTVSPLRVDEAVLHYLTGVGGLDERLERISEPVEPAPELVPSHQTLVDRLVAAWSAGVAETELPAIQLCGVDAREKRAIASATCAALGLQLHAMPAGAVPSSPADVDTLGRLWTRAAAMRSVALLLDCDEVDAADVQQMRTVASLVERVRAPLVLSSRERWGGTRRRMLALDVHRPSGDEQRALWHAALEHGVVPVNGHVEELVSHFSLSAPAIRSVAAEVLSGDMSGDGMAADLWAACRVQARPRLDDLAQRIEPAARWSQLVLPDLQREMLHEIAGQVRHRATVYERWGFGERGARGLGITALFSGPSGTGKTMAAEVLANELRLDLYRIDLSSVVSKYIGETEKNLRRVFDAADEGGAILLFDEADALFGKRSEVKDSHDRYANIEVSYLLQRMEAYRGLAILTTNLRKALDAAFARRIRFVVQFPFPDAGQRRQIWRRIFPCDAPREDLDFERLARLNVAGGNIRNIALNAAFLAAKEGDAVRMAHLYRAAQAEYAKLDKPMTTSELDGWQ